MRILEILTEAREAPIYHFTSEKKLFNILSTDKLMGRGGMIYFTRNYARQFLPHSNEMLSGTSWGLRINQELLHRDYGKKLVAGGAPQRTWTAQQRADWLADPKNADEIEKVKADPKYTGGGLSIGGQSSPNIVRGTTSVRGRDEDEEHLMVSELDNLHRYITGIVITTNHGAWGPGEERSARPSDAQEAMIDLMVRKFPGRNGFEERNKLIDYAIKFNIPFLYQRVEMPATELKNRIIKFYQQRKSDREKEAGLPMNVYTLLTNRQGGGTIVMARSIEAAIKDAQNRLWNKFPNGIIGYQTRNDNNEKVDTFFDKPVMLKVPAGI